MSLAAPNPLLIRFACCVTETTLGNYETSSMLTQNRPEASKAVGSDADRNSTSTEKHRERTWIRGAVLAAIILAGITLRVWTMARANWMLDADEAILGIMANHIRQGEWPIFFYGQAYMGAFQAYATAVSYEIFGMSRVSFKFITIPEFVIFAVSIFLLARRTYGSNAALLATLLAALPPVYVLSVTTKILGPVLLSMTVGNFILLLAIKQAYAVTPTERPWTRYLLIGALGGFGFWLHGQIIIYLAAAGLILFLGNPRIVIQPRILVAGVAGFLIGGAPVFRFAMNHEYTTFHHLLGVGAEDVERRYFAVTIYYLREILPRIAGVASPWTPMPQWIQVLTALVVGCAIVSLAAHRYRGILGWFRLSLRQGDPKDALLIFGGIASLAFIISNFGNLAVEFPYFDASGRYAAPLASVLPIIIAGEISRLARYSRPLAAAAFAIVILSTAVGYVRTEPTDLWQSPYWRYLPSSNNELIAVLDDLEVDTVWMNQWAGKPLIFDTNERISAADYWDLRIGGGIDRLFEHSNRVRAAELPAFAFRWTDEDWDDDRNDIHISFEDWLDEHGIPYEKRTTPNYVIIHPRQHIQLDDIPLDEINEHLGIDNYSR